jgi:NAD(P)-dependent dehydrogenase (short-subunit alcohol dehydrogenase family)
MASFLKFLHGSPTLGWISDSLELLRNKTRTGSFFGTERRATWVDISGKVAVVTGANTGIGKETALALAKMGATVVLACRSEERTRPVIEEIVQKSQCTSSKVLFMPLELGSMKSIRDFVQTLKASGLCIDILVNNAGVTIDVGTKTEDGLEMMFGMLAVSPVSIDACRRGNLR